MILNQRKEGSQISVQLCLQLGLHKMRTNSLTLPTWNTLRIWLFQTHHKRCVPAVHAQVLKRIRFPECISKAKFSNFKLLVTLPNNTGAGKKSVPLIHPSDTTGAVRTRNKEIIARKAEHLSTTNISLRSETGTLNAHWRTLYVYARSIRYVID